MFNRKREIPQQERLNLVPIMDAVFIFIFFLLFSAQFIKIFEIETEAPVVSEVPQEQKMDKEPLNLIVKVYDRKIEFLTGVDQIIFDTFFKTDENYKILMKDQLIKLRMKHPDDDHVIISPAADILYDEIIQLIDVVQRLPDDKTYKLMVKGKEKILTKIFTQLVLEPMDEDV